MSLELAKSIGIPVFPTLDVGAISGNIFWVDSGGGGNDTPHSGSYDLPFLTLDYAIGKCTANNGDAIFMKPGHAETLASASAITHDVAGITVVGLGSGADRPTFTFSDTAATMVISAASVKMLNFITTPSVDSVVSPIVVSGADCTLDYAHQDASAAVEAVAALLTTAGADKLNLNLDYRGFIAGNACVNAVRLVGVDTGRIHVDFYGVASTAIVEFHTTACNNIEVTGNHYNSGTTDYSKNVVDTVGGSTWSVKAFDSAAGSGYSGGSAAAVAGDDVGAVSAAIAVIDAFHDVPTADVVTNAQMRDVVGNKADAAATGAVSATESLMAYAKQNVTLAIARDTAIGVIDAFHDVPAGDAATNAQMRDVIGNKTDTNAGNSVYSYHLVQTADAATNTTMRDVVGNKTDAAVYSPGTTKSLLAHLKGVSDLQEKTVVTSAATMVNGNTIFTVAGGPIRVLGLWSECVTINDGTASTLQYNATPTVGSAQTLSGASGSLANANPGASVSLIGGTLATAALYNGNGPNLGMSTGGGDIIVPAGVITMVIGTGSTTGTWRHYLRYAPLTTGVTVS